MRSAALSVDSKSVKSDAVVAEVIVDQVFGDLVDIVRPGDEVTVTGTYLCKEERRIG